jgi:hypothetical protein
MRRLLWWLMDDDERGKEFRVGIRSDVQVQAQRQRLIVPVPVPRNTASEMGRGRDGELNGKRRGLFRQVSGSPIVK